MPDMDKPIAVINWCGADIKALKPDWSDERCISWLESYSRSLEERSIELGWEVIDVLLQLGEK